MSCLPNSSRAIKTRRYCSRNRKRKWTFSAKRIQNKKTNNLQILSTVIRFSIIHFRFFVPYTQDFKNIYKINAYAREEISRLKFFSFFYKQVRDIYKTVIKKSKDKKRVSENHAHILLAAFTSFTR